MLSKTLLSFAGAALLAAPATAAPSQLKILDAKFETDTSALKWSTPSFNRVSPVGVEIASTASWYGPGFHGRRTASGEVFNQNAMTAAHRSLPFGTRVKVTNLRNGRSVIVRITDDGPHVGGRVIDLSRGAATRIGMLSSGVAPVKLKVLR